MKGRKCKDCSNFIGAGDWNLCCTNPPENQITVIGHLCYAEDPACENFKEIENRNMFKANEKVDELSRIMCWFSNCPKTSCSAVNCETTWTAQKILDAGWCNKEQAYNELLKQLYQELRQYGPEDKFNKTFFLEVLEKAIEASK